MSSDPGVGELGDEIFRAGPLTLDARRRLVTAGGQAIGLTRTEFSILELLMRNAGIVLERSTIYDHISGYDFGSGSRSLDVHVGYLHRKIEANGSSRLIEMVRVVGFVLRPPPERLRSWWRRATVSGRGRRGRYSSRPHRGFTLGARFQSRPGDCPERG